MKNIIILLQNKKKKKNRCLGRASETIPVLTDGDVEDHRKAHLFAFPACGG